MLWGSLHEYSYFLIQFDNKYSIIIFNVSSCLFLPVHVVQKIHFTQNVYSNIKGNFSFKY